MTVAVLLGWLISGGLGLRLLTLWADAVPGRVRRQPDVLGYASGIAGGLLVWLCAMVTGWIALTWISALVLVTSVVVGERLFLAWFPDRWSSRQPDALVYVHASCTVMTLVLAVLVCFGL